MKCPKCQAENSQERRFCRTCGGQLILPCPHCGFENLPNDEFCGGCGHDLKKEILTPPHLSHPRSDSSELPTDKVPTSGSTAEGERKHVTVLFSDLSGYTAMAEKLDPEETQGIMDGCFKIPPTVLSSFRVGSVAWEQLILLRKEVFC